MIEVGPMSAMAPSRELPMSTYAAQQFPNVFDNPQVNVRTIEARKTFPGLKIVAHPECTEEVADQVDFLGSTGEMMKYVKSTDAPYFLMLTECGLVSRLAVEDPEKNFIGGCRLCPYMKMNSLVKIRDALKAPKPEQVITLDAELSRRAARCIERMFELAA